jgi:4-oxalocrotonate tautomerase
MMPIISIHISPIADDTKEKLIKNLTEAAARSTSIKEDSFTVLIHELDQKNIGLGGVDLKTIKEKS